MTRTLLHVLAAALACTALRAAAATITGTITMNGQPAAGIIVYFDNGEPTDTAPAPDAVVMDQHNLQFVPTLLPVVAGTTIAFTNGDDIQHNVFSPSAIAGKFDLGAYGPGAKRSVTLTEPGEVVVLCNIHMEMEAHIIVLRQPYFCVTKADGSYRIPDVPPGTYRAEVWRAHTLPSGASVTVTGDGDATLDLAIAQ